MMETLFYQQIGVRSIRNLAETVPDALYHQTPCSLSGRKETHQVEKITSDLPNDSRKSGSEELLYTHWPAAVHRVILYVIYPLERA